MSDLPAPTTRRETIQLYEALAKEYIKYDGKKKYVPNLYTIHEKNRIYS